MNHTPGYMRLIRHRNEPIAFRHTDDLDTPTFPPARKTHEPDRWHHSAEKRWIARAMFALALKISRRCDELFIPWLTVPEQPAEYKRTRAYMHTVLNEIGLARSTDT